MAGNTPHKRGGIGKTIVQAVLERGGGEVRVRVDKRDVRKHEPKKRATSDVKPR